MLRSFIVLLGGLWQVGEEPFRFSPRSGMDFRVFCSTCATWLDDPALHCTSFDAQVYISLYFYVKDMAC